MAVVGCRWLLVVGCCWLLVVASSDVISFLRWSSKRRNSLLLLSAPQASDCKRWVRRTNDSDRPERVAVDLGVFYLRCARRKRAFCSSTRAARASACRPWPRRMRDWERPGWKGREVMFFFPRWKGVTFCDFFYVILLFNWGSGVRPILGCLKRRSVSLFAWHGEPGSTLLQSRIDTLKNIQTCLMIQLLDFRQRIGRGIFWCGGMSIIILRGLLHARTTGLQKYLFKAGHEKRRWFYRLWPVHHVFRFLIWEHAIL